MKLTQQELLALGPEARAQIARELGRQKQSKYRAMAETINGIRVKAAWAIFGDSYRYRAEYNAYKKARMEIESGTVLPGQCVMEGFI